MKILKSIFIAIIAVAFTACGNYVEEINIDENGQGSYKVYTDVIPSSIEMGVQMSMMFAGMDTTIEIDQDSLRNAIAESVWEDFPNEVDSTFSIASEMPDSLKNNPEVQKFAQNAVGFMRGGKDQGHVFMGVEYDFESVDEFQKFLSFMEEMQDASSQTGGGPMESLSKTKANIEYSLDKNAFARSVTYTNPQDLDDESLVQLGKMMGKDGTYQTVVNTKRKIKKVKGEHIKSQSDYQVVFEYNFIEVMTGNSNTDFEIIF